MRATPAAPSTLGLQARLLRSSPVLVDPVYPFLQQGNAAAGRGVLLFTRQWRALKWRQLVSSLKSSYAEAMYVRRFPGRLTRSHIEQEALELFREINALMLAPAPAASGGGNSGSISEEMLADKATETLVPYLARGRRTAVRLGGLDLTRMRILGIDSPPQLVQFRVHHVSGANSVGFIQATVRITTEQIPVIEPDVVESKPRQKHHQQEIKPARLPSPPDSWRSAIAPNGDTYYYNRRSLHATYTKPFFFGVESFYFPIENWTLGDTGTILDKPGTLTSSSEEKKTKIVQNYVMLERPLHLPTAKWRIHHF